MSHMQETETDRTSACSSFSLDDRLMFLSLHMGFSFASAAAVCRSYCLVGLVAKASASRAEDPGFESGLRRDFSGVESYYM